MIPEHTNIYCRNCGERVVIRNFATGLAWMHQPAGSSFQDNMYEYCKIYRAEPRSK